MTPQSVVAEHWSMDKPLKWTQQKIIKSISASSLIMTTTHKQPRKKHQKIPKNPYLPSQHIQKKKQRKKYKKSFLFSGRDPFISGRVCIFYYWRSRCPRQKKKKKCGERLFNSTPATIMT